MFNRSRSDSILRHMSENISVLQHEAENLKTGLIELWLMTKNIQLVFEKDRLEAKCKSIEAKYDELRCVYENETRENRIRSISVKMRNENKKLYDEMEPVDILDFFRDLDFAFARDDDEYTKIRVLAQHCPSSLVRAIDFRLSYESTKLLIMNLIVPKMSDKPRLREELTKMQRCGEESILRFVKRIDAHVYMINPNQTTTERVATVVYEYISKAPPYVQIKLERRSKNFASIFDFVVYAQEIGAEILAEREFLRRK